MKTKFIILIVITVISMCFNNLYSQTIKAGIRFDPGILFTEQSNQSESDLLLYSLGANLLVETCEYLDLEFRPGYVNNGDYGGFEIGGYARFNILPTKIFIVAGLNNHYNRTSNNHNGGGSYKKEMLFKGFGIGYQIGTNQSLDITYYWTNDKAFSYSRKTDWSSYSYYTDKYLNGIIKLGMNITFSL